MTRLTLEPRTPQGTVLSVDGWVAGENVALLEREGARLLQRAERLVLYLSGVRFIDRTGIDLLKRWAGPDLVLRGASPFVGALLAYHGLVPPERQGQRRNP